MDIEICKYERAPAPESSTHYAHTQKGDHCKDKDDRTDNMTRQENKATTFLHSWKGNLENHQNYYSWKPKPPHEVSPSSLTVAGNPSLHMCLVR
ncbi:hypothetical protein LR48_Vigan10g149700 [Vigna angularis]|uniref:Uncharacterized protein n=1 Tax=Phaseolus angularis TaxID=3914 RepID=A0A0L9VKM7_PHAAN|nr:hypothetical protein LR48_Vigan10g149700 [Vigna angularis]